MREKHDTVQVTPEDIVNDYLIGSYELEKLAKGFAAPVIEGEPCAEHRHLTPEIKA